MLTDRGLDRLLSTTLPVRALLPDGFRISWGAGYKILHAAAAPGCQNYLDVGMAGFQPPDWRLEACPACMPALERQRVTTILDALGAAHRVTAALERELTETDRLLNKRVSWSRRARSWDLAAISGALHRARNILLSVDFPEGGVRAGRGLPADTAPVDDRIDCWLNAEVETHRVHYRQSVTRYLNLHPILPGRVRPKPGHDLRAADVSGADVSGADVSDFDRDADRYVWVPASCHDRYGPGLSPLLSDLLLSQPTVAGGPCARWQFGLGGYARSVLITVPPLAARVRAGESAAHAGTSDLGAVDGGDTPATLTVFTELMSNQARHLTDPEAALAVARGITHSAGRLQDDAARRIPAAGTPEVAAR
jgi:hypothetical protein